MNREKFCQMCAMPLNDDNIATDKDGNPSLFFCSLCVTEGKYHDKDLTFDQMYKKGIDGIRGSETLSDFKKGMFTKMYKGLLKKQGTWNTRKQTKDPEFKEAHEYAKK